MSSQTTEYYYDDTTTFNPHLIMEKMTSTESPRATFATFLLNANGNDSENGYGYGNGNINGDGSSFRREHLEHNKITFEIPSHHDLQHIDSMHNFNTLLKRIGNVVTSSADAATQLTGSNHNQHQHQQQQQEHLLTTNAEISKSVVLDLADLKANNDGNFDFERFFAGTDMHSVINYLWIGVVTSLIILSIIFIVFSCYFYRKFREWKKCNKDIRAHLNGNSNNNNNNNNNSEILYGHGSGLIGTAATAYLGQIPIGNAENTAYYQMESPPCYTIATGLPTYDEALLHYQHYQQHHQHQQYHYYDCNATNHQEKKYQNYFDYALKYMNSTPTVIHQQQRYQNQEEQQQHMDIVVQHVNGYATNIANGHFIRNWKKMHASTLDAVTVVRNDTEPATATATDINVYCNGNGNGNVDVDANGKISQYCCTANNVDHKNSTEITSIRKEQKEHQSMKISTQSPPPAYDVTASVALLSADSSDSSSSSSWNITNDIESTPMLLSDEILVNHNITESLNVATSSLSTTSFSHRNEADIDDSLNGIIIA